MADLYGVALGGGLTGNVDGNARKLLGDGASGIGPYTRFGTPQLQAIKVISASVNFTTTPAASNSNLYKAVTAIQSLAEVYYVGIPTASGANQFIALVHFNKTDAGDGYGASSSADGSYDNLEEVISIAITGSDGDVTITNSTLTGLSFN
jgi:hypothetical protein